MPASTRTCIYACLGMIGAVACLSAFGCWGGSGGSAPTRFAMYPQFSLETQDGKTFTALSIDKALLAPNTFKVRFPSGEETFLEDLTIEALEQNAFFDRKRVFFEGVGMTVSIEDEEISYFGFRPPYEDPRAAGKPAVTLIYLPANKEITLPLTREEMEVTFGKEYNLQM